jgi:AcrR family transcriptional regulator
MTERADPPAGPPAIGRREANKQATREALLASARRLFAEQGYRDTGVRDIAEAAGVTERTFFRYFAGKQDLVLDEVLEWLPRLGELVVARPAGEKPLVAVRMALDELGVELAEAAAPAPVWLFLDGRPNPQAHKAGAGALLRLEATLAEALRERIAPADGPGGGDYPAQVYARTAVALLRSALIRSGESGAEPPRLSGGTGALLDRAFALLEAG